MQFKKPQTIAAQIAGHICDQLVRGKWQSDERLPSVRDMAGRLQVNPNTMMRVYADLQDRGILYNRRGIGVFVSPGAPQRIRDFRRERFISQDLPNLFHTLDALQFEIVELEALYREHCQGKGEVHHHGE